MKRLTTLLFVLTFTSAAMLHPAKAQESYKRGEFVSATTADTLLYRYLTPQTIKKARNTRWSSSFMVQEKEATITRPSCFMEADSSSTL